MKINWGTGIVIAFVLFIAFIMYFVVIANTDSRYDHDLVTEEYYKQELGFQEQLDKEQRSKDRHMEVVYTRNEEGVLLTFPVTGSLENIKGSVFLYRPSDKQLDFEIPISLSDAHLLIPKDRLLDGRWNIVIDWEDGKEAYYYKIALNY